MQRIAATLAAGSVVLVDVAPVDTELFCNISRAAAFGVCSHRGELFRQRILSLMETPGTFSIGVAARHRQSLHRENGLPHPR